MNIPAKDRRLIFVDTETTGIDSKSDRLVELAWAEMEGPIRTMYFGVKEVPPFIDELIGFTKRDLASKTEMSPAEKHAFLNTTYGHTMVAANPAFDKAFMEENHLFEFAYRMLDIETYAMAKLRLDYVPSMNDIYTILRDMGYTAIGKPEHTAESDVACMRAAFKVLKYL